MKLLLEITFVILFSVFLGYNNLIELWQNAQETHMTKFQGTNLTLEYPAAFRLNQKTTENKYTDGLQKVFGVLYSTSEGEFEFSVELGDRGFETGNSTSETRTVNGTPYERGLKFDQKNNVVYAYYSPKNPNSVFTHIQATFPKKNGQHYLTLFDEMVSTLNIHDL